MKKTIKVIAKDDGQAIKEVTFAGKVLTDTDEIVAEGYAIQNNRLWVKGFGPNYSTAKSGRIRVTMNKDFKLKKIEVGTPGLVVDKDGDTVHKDAPNTIDSYYNWKKVKNGKKIKLSKVNEGKTGEWKEENKIKEHKEVSNTTKIRITYYDKKNKTTYRATYTIERVNK